MVFRKALLVCFLVPNLFGAKWVDATDGSIEHATGSSFELVDAHVYRPAAAVAWVGTDVTLPDKAKVVVRPPNVANFLGNTYSQLTITASGELTLYGVSGVQEIVTSLVKNGAGVFKLHDQTAGGLRIEGWTANGSAKIADVVINVFGSGTTLDLDAALDPPVGQSPLTVNLESQAIATLLTLATVPKLTGFGRLTLSNIVAIANAELGRLSIFKGILETRSSGTTDIVITTAETSIWTLSGATEVKWTDLKNMKGTVRLAASTRINFSGTGSL